MKTAPQFARGRSRQSGYVMLVILLGLALLLIALTAAAPRMAQEIKRDREEELIHRGNQYARAIKRYYKKFGRYPTRLEDLENTNNLRFLRKRYTDPISGKDEWRLIHLGEAKAAPPGVAQAGTQGGAASSPLAPASSGMGTPTAANTPFSPGGQSSAGVGSSPGTQPGSQTGSQPGTPASQLATGPVLGSGGAIVGVSSMSEKESLKELNGKNHYNEWEFVYDPRLDPQAQLMGPAGINPNAQGLGQQPGVSPFGNPMGPQPGPGQPPGQAQPRPPR